MLHLTSIENGNFSVQKISKISVQNSYTRVYESSNGSGQEIQEESGQLQIFSK